MSRANHSGSVRPRLRAAVIAITVLASLAFAGSALAATSSQVTVSRANGWGTGTITSNPNGMSCSSTCQGFFTNNTTVTLTAVPAAGSTFAGWTGACSGSSVTCTIVVTAATLANAAFDLVSPVRLDVASVGGGIVSSNPLVIFCGNNQAWSCWGNFASGSNVTLQAAPAAHAAFVGWSGACSGTPSICVVSMSEAKNVTATFTPRQRAVVSMDGRGSATGTVSSNPAGVICPSACDVEFVNGTVLTLTAVANPGSVFAGWSGACSGSTPTCTLTMDALRWVTALFSPPPVPFSIAKAGTGSGSVTSYLGGFDCGSTCVGELPALESVTLTATPDAGSAFTGWSGACGGTSVTCIVVVWAADSVTATFALVPPEPAIPTAPAPIDTAPLLPAPDLAPAVPLVPGAPAAPVQAPVAPGPLVPAPRAKARPTIRTRPKISGRTRIGAALSCTRGAWNGGPSRYAFTWRRDGKVAGRGSSHVVRAADLGHVLRCEVTAKNAAGASTAKSVALRVPR